MLPQALLMGIDEELFWSLNPRRMKAYEKAYQMQEQRFDRHLWTLGQYMLSALTVTMDHSFNKNAHSKYVEKPFLQDAFLTKEEIKEQKIAEVNKIFSFLEGLEKNK